MLCSIRVILFFSWKTFLVRKISLANHKLARTLKAFVLSYYFCNRENREEIFHFADDIRLQMKASSSKITGENCGRLVLKIFYPFTLRSNQDGNTEENVEILFLKNTEEQTTTGKCSSEALI